MKKYGLCLIVTVMVVLSSCSENKSSDASVLPYEIEADQTTIENSKSRPLSSAFKKYWYQGTAEITSYKLTQSRYGELREGTAVTIFVTEDFIPEKQVKADGQKASNIGVLKLNKTKHFNTGIYPYNIMTSIFNPVKTDNHALKISHSIQEWCGQTYMQLNNRDAFEITGHSYFEREGDESILLSKTWMEDELFNIIRIKPEALPIGIIQILPAFETLRLTHKDIKAYTAVASLEKKGQKTVFTLAYKDAARRLKIDFTTKFPHTIEKWEETHENGQVTSAVKMKRMQSAYWNQNSNTQLVLRDSLGL
ncbi:MAG: hypothetical protein ACI9RL_001593 [Candidatus Paceibacteria bacterium]|jgi:hypothetical protein